MNAILRATYIVVMRDDHVNAGTPADPLYCPLTLALKQELGAHWQPSIGKDRITIRPAHDFPGRIVNVKIFAEIRRWLEAYDDGVLMQPLDPVSVNIDRGIATVDITLRRNAPKRQTNALNLVDEQRHAVYLRRETFDEAMQARGLSFRALSRLIDVDDGFISQLYRHRRACAPRTRKKIVAELKRRDLFVYQPAAPTGRFDRKGTQEKARIDQRLYFRALDENNLMMKQVAEASSISPKHLSRIVYGYSHPPYTTQKRIADALGVYTTRLFKRDVPA